MGYIQFNEQAENVIKFDIMGKELREHCTARAEFHKERAEFFAKKEKEFGDEVVTYRETTMIAGIASGQIGMGSIESNRVSMGNQKGQHEDKKRFFRFSAAHLMREKYELTEEQTRRFELIA